MNEISKFRRPQVKWKVTAESTSKKQKFAKPEKWRGSAKWKVKGQVKDCTQMKANALVFEQLSTWECPSARMYRVKGSSLVTMCLYKNIFYSLKKKSKHSVEGD